MLVLCVFGEFCEILNCHKCLCSFQKYPIPAFFHFLLPSTFSISRTLIFCGIIDSPPLLVGLPFSRWVILSLSVPQQFLHESLMAPLRLLMGVWKSYDFHIQSSSAYLWNLKWLSFHRTRIRHSPFCISDSVWWRKGRGPVVLHLNISQLYANYLLIGHLLFFSKPLVSAINLNYW